MCIIVYKPENVEPLKKNLYKECFRNNPDGAGYTFFDTAKQKWIIKKGFMHFKAFWRSFNGEEFSKEDITFVHFRVGTSGLKDEGNTHPYPCSSDPVELRKTYVETDMAAIHNGVVGFGEKVLSDTGAHMRDYVSPLMKYAEQDDAIMKALEKICECHKCRWVFLTPTMIHLAGTWVEDPLYPGIKFSNKSYEKYVPPAVTHVTTNKRYNYMTGKWEDEEKMRNKAKHSGGNYADNSGNVITGFNAKFDAPKRKAKMNVDTGEIVWDDEDDELIINLSCPCCFDDTMLQDSGVAGHTIGDTICCNCGAVFDDQTGFIHFYDTEMASNARISALN